MGAGAFDLYRICEELARIDLGVATGVLATFLGSDPISVGGTPEQKKHWLTRIADEGILMAYGATEPAAGSDLAALRTTAARVQTNGAVVGYTLNGTKQWISNGGVADAYTVLANAPGGPCWFVVERGAQGFSHGKPEDKHGIRASNTAALTLDDVYVDADRLVGGVEGQGLLQAQAVFGYTRLMVAAFGLGAGWAALDRAIPLLDDAHPGRRPAVREAGLHAQADRAARRAPRSEPRLHRGGRHASRRRRARPEHRGRDRQVPGHGSGQRGRRRHHPGARRLRLHARVHGREDQARRAHHHDLRGHLRDHGDDDQPRPLAGAPEDARPALPRAGARDGGAARARARGRRRRRGAGPARARRGAGARADRSPHAPPAHSPAPRRADRVRRVCRQRRAARGGGRCARPRGPVRVSTRGRAPASAGSSPAKRRSRSPATACAGCVAPERRRRRSRSRGRASACRRSSAPRRACSPIWIAAPTRCTARRPIAGA